MFSGIKCIHIYSDRLSSRPMGWSETNVDKMARLRVLAANGENILVVTRNTNNITKEKQEQINNQKEVSKMIKKERYKREDGICFSIPEIKYGDYELSMKLKEIIECKAI